MTGTVIKLSHMAVLLVPLTVTSTVMFSPGLWRRSVSILGHSHLVVRVSLSPNLRLSYANTLTARSLSSGTRDCHDLLIDLGQENWNSIADGLCLINFSEDERAEHAAEEAAYAEYARNLTQLSYELGCTENFSVNPEHYETAMKLVKKLRDEWDESAMKGPFPIYEGAPSYFLN